MLKKRAKKIEIGQFGRAVSEIFFTVSLPPYYASNHPYHQKVTIFHAYAVRALCIFFDIFNISKELNCLKFLAISGGHNFSVIV